jgi:LysM repeat protein
MQANPPQKNQYFGALKRLMPPAFAACIIVAATFGILSKTAYAGLFSSLWSILGNEQASAQIGAPSNSHLLNSQKYPLPTYSANGSPLALARSATTTAPIYDGNTLSPEMAAESEASNAEPHNTQISVYTVRSGDTISTVAKMFNVSMNTILWANDLTSKSVLRQGQTLVILPVTGLTYTVKKGDTIQGIAKKYNADVNDILNYNDITLTSPLGIGDKLLLPDAEMSATVIPSGLSVAKVSIGSSALIDGQGGPSFNGYFSCPVPGSHISQGLHGHNGVDLADARGTPIRAAAAGTVIISRANGAWNGGYGNFVVILHGNSTQTLYAHMLKTSVSSGERVAQNQIIGYIGMTGLTTGPHLHFEIRGAQNPFGSRCQ